MTNDQADVALADRLRAIEEQPLAERAAAYAALRDELAMALEPGTSDSPAPDSA